MAMLPSDLLPVPSRYRHDVDTLTAWRMQLRGVKIAVCAKAVPDAVDSVPVLVPELPEVPEVVVPEVLSLVGPAFEDWIADER